MATPESCMEAQREEIPAKAALAEKKFPVGMRIVIVDDDKTCLAMLHRLLCRCEYEVTSFSNSREALKMIREKKDEIDLVITDVHMPGIDGFQLLEIAGLELDLPVIMLSANEQTEVVMKGIMHGACDYLIKPVRVEELRVIWKHVAKRRKPLHELNKGTIGNNVGADVAGSAETRPSGTAEKKKNRMKTKGRRMRKENSDEEDSDEREYEERSARKKQRVVWTTELHHKFVTAVSEIGIDKAVPKGILQRMKVEDLTRENVASHLQKYRLYLKRLPNGQDDFLASTYPSNFDFSSFERFKNFHDCGRYRRFVPNSTSRYRSTRFNNTSVNSPRRSVFPNLAPSSQPTQIGRGTGFTNAGTNNFVLANNNFMNNQANLYRGITGMNFFPSTSNSIPINQVSNRTNYVPMPIMPPASQFSPAPLGYPMTNYPVFNGTGSMLGPQFGASTNLIGENFTSGTGDELQQVVNSFNSLRTVPNPAITENRNHVNYENLGPAFNNPSNAPVPMSCGSEMGPVIPGVGGFGETSFGAANRAAEMGPVTQGVGEKSFGVASRVGEVGPVTHGGGGFGETTFGAVNCVAEIGPVTQVGGGFGETSFGAANSVADQVSTSSINGGDDVTIHGLDDLLASVLKTSDDGNPFSFFDDDLFN